MATLSSEALAYGIPGTSLLNGLEGSVQPPGVWEGPPYASICCGILV